MSSLLIFIQRLSSCKMSTLDHKWFNLTTSSSKIKIPTNPTFPTKSYISNKTLLLSHTILKNSYKVSIKIWTLRNCFCRVMNPIVIEVYSILIPINSWARSNLKNKATCKKWWMAKNNSPLMTDNKLKKKSNSKRELPKGSM